MKTANVKKKWTEPKILSLDSIPEALGADCSSGSFAQGDCPFGSSAGGTCITFGGTAKQRTPR
jgi:hypothetical protein